MKKLILIGKGHGWWDAPKDVDKDTEIWGINDLIYQRTQVDRMFNMHCIEDHAEVDTVCTKLASHMGIPIYMPKTYEHLPTSIAFPLKEAMEEFGTDYFYTGIVYMFALAIMEGFKQIDCYGINMRGTDEKYKNARHCVEFWTGIAMGRGVKVNYHGKYTDCLKTIDRRLYGYNLLQTMPENINDRALHTSFIISLDRFIQGQAMALMKEQKETKYFMNFKPCPVKIPDPVFIEVLENLYWKEGDGVKHVGNISYYDLYHVDRIMTYDTGTRIAFIENDMERTIRDWEDFSQGCNLWTDPKSKHWNGDKRHEYEIYFPKYDLPRIEALKKFLKEYEMVAKRCEFKFPSRFKIFPSNILETEEGKKEVLNHIGYEIEETKCLTQS